MIGRVVRWSCTGFGYVVMSTGREALMDARWCLVTQPGEEVVFGPGDVVIFDTRAMKAQRGENILCAVNVRRASRLDKFRARCRGEKIPSLPRFRFENPRREAHR